MNQLPETYLTWLGQLGEKPLVEYADREWYLDTKEELIKSTKVDGCSTPKWAILKSYADSFAELSGQESTVDENGNSISLDFLRQSVAIGDDNGDVLFVSKEAPHSVWCYFPGGGDVKKLGDSLVSFISDGVSISK